MRLPGPRPDRDWVPAGAGSSSARLAARTSQELSDSPSWAAAVSARDFSPSGSRRVTRDVPVSSSASPRLASGKGGGGGSGGGGGARSGPWTTANVGLPADRRNSLASPFRHAGASA